MTTPARYDLTIRRGDTFAKTFRLKTGPADARVPANLTGSSMVVTIEPGGGRPAITITKAGDATGEVPLSLSPSDTASLPSGRIGRWRLERQIGANEDTLIRGDLVVTAQDG